MIKEIIFIVASSILLIGCKSSEIVVQPTKCWEGHYFSEKEFFSGTKNMKLEKKESVWVLSNSTLKRLLKENYNETVRTNK